MRKGILTLIIVAVVALSLALVGPVVYKLLTDHGVAAGQLDSSGAQEASIPLDGHWEITSGSSKNKTAVGYTFNEVLPGQRKTTSGRAYLKDGNIASELSISESKLNDAKMTVQLDSISSDVQKRDVNVRNKILETHKYPEATFELTDPVDLGSVPSDGSIGTVNLTGNLSIHGQTRSVSTPAKVLRTGERLIVQGNLEISRHDFNIDAASYLAATIADEGTLDFLLVFART